MTGFRIPAMSDVSPDLDDPCPRAPLEPAPNECCGSGCPLCVYDLYAEELARYRIALAAWRQRHPEQAADA